MGLDMKKIIVVFIMLLSFSMVIYADEYNNYICSQDEQYLADLKDLKRYIYKYYDKQELEFAKDDVIVKGYTYNGNLNQVFKDASSFYDIINEKNFYYVCFNSEKLIAYNKYSFVASNSYIKDGDGWCEITSYLLYGGENNLLIDYSVHAVISNIKSKHPDLDLSSLMFIAPTALQDLLGTMVVFEDNGQEYASYYGVLNTDEDPFTEFEYGEIVPAAQMLRELDRQFTEIEEVETDKSEEISYGSSGTKMSEYGVNAIIVSFAAVSLLLIILFAIRKRRGTTE